GPGRAQGARRHREEAQLQPDAGRARLADAAQVDHRADRVGDQPAAAQGPDCLAQRQARCRRRRRHRQGERARLMLVFRQLFDPTSSTYTYLLGCSVTKEAVLIDPVFEQVRRDAALIAELGLTLLWSLETHVHADHVTGAWL